MNLTEDFMPELFLWNWKNHSPEGGHIEDDDSDVSMRPD